MPSHLVAQPFNVETAMLPPMVIYSHAQVTSLANVSEDGSFLSAKGYQTRTFPVLPMAQGFSAHHTNDAHTCCYAIKHLPTGQFISDQVVRMSKPGLALMHALRDGGSRKVMVPEHVRELLGSIEPMGTMLLVDLDNENHAPWSAELRERSMVMLRDAATKNELFARPSLFHTTRGGMRLVWMLSEAVPVEGRRGLEDLLCGLIMTARQCGLVSDASCGDWTRLFRLPLVSRPSKADERVLEQTWVGDYLAMSWGRVDFNAKEEAPPGPVLVYPPARFRAFSEYTRAEIESGSDIVRYLGTLWDRKIEKEPGRAVTMLLDIDTGACPDAAAVADFTQSSESDQALDFKSIRSWVKARAYPGGKNAVPDPAAKWVWEMLYGGGCLVDDPKVSGQLHANLLTLTNRLAWVLRQRLNETDATPQMLYLLCIQAAKRANEKRRQAGADARPDADLEREVWSAVESAYRMRVSEQKAFAESQKEDEEGAREKALLAGRIRSTMEGAFKLFLMEAVERGTEGGDVSKIDQAWVEENFHHLLIADTPDGLSVATRDQVGRWFYSMPVKTHGALLAACRDAGHQLIDIYHPLTNPTEPPRLKSQAELQHDYSIGVPHLTLSRELPRNRIRLVANGDVLEPTFDMAAYGMRQDIEPIRDRRVEHWLQLLGGEHHEKLLDWLACYTKIERPMTGLYIQGAPSIGKGMLGRALTCMTQARLNGKLEHVLEQFQDSMFKTPLVWGDEEASPSTKVTKSMMNTYKKLVSGEFDSLNPKGKTARTVTGYWRVYLTANGDRYLRLNEDINESDLDALVVRTLHILADSEGCARYLREIGGIAATAGWPEHNIPCHIAWLRETRQVIPGSRLLVEGVRTDYHEQLSLNTNTSDMILRAVAKLFTLASGTGSNKFDQVYEVAPPEADQPWILYMRAEALHTAMNDIFREDRTATVPTARAVEQALKFLSGKTRSVLKRLAMPKLMGAPCRVWPIPLAHMLGIMDRMGLDFECRKVLGEAAWTACATAAMQDAYRNTPPQVPKPKAQSIQFPVPTGGQPTISAPTPPVVSSQPRMGVTLTPSAFPTVRDR